MASIRAYIKAVKIGTTESGYLAKRYQELDCMIDAVGEHARVLNAQRDRINKVVKAEDESGEMSNGLKEEIKLYNELLKDHIKIKQALGVIPLPVETRVNTSKSSDVTSVLDKARNLMLEERKKVKVTKKPKEVLN